MNTDPTQGTGAQYQAVCNHHSRLSMVLFCYPRGLALTLFSSGNHGNHDKKAAVTATDPAPHSGNPGNPGNPEKNTVKVKNENNSAVVICYTPNGNPINVEARDPEHAAWLQRMNPHTQTG